MAGFRFHNAHIALRQTDKARVAIALIKAFSRFLMAVYAENFAAVTKLQVLADSRIQLQPGFADRQTVCHRVPKFRFHFV